MPTLLLAPHQHRGLVLNGEAMLGPGWYPAAVGQQVPRARLQWVKDSRPSWNGGSRTLQDVRGPVQSGVWSVWGSLVDFGEGKGLGVQEKTRKTVLKKVGGFWRPGLSGFRGAANHRCPEA